MYLAKKESIVRYFCERQEASQLYFLWKILVNLFDANLWFPSCWVLYSICSFIYSLWVGIFACSSYARKTSSHCSIPWHVLLDVHIESTTGNYYPTVFFNEFWLLRDKLIPMNDTVTEVPLHLEVSPISMTKWQLFLQMDQSFQIHRSYGSMLDGESDELKVSFTLFCSTHWHNIFAHEISRCGWFVTKPG